MGKKSFFLDASVLRINDGTPVKVTFLEARTSGHFVGFYTLDAGAFHDIRTLFPPPVISAAVYLNTAGTV